MTLDDFKLNIKYRLGYPVINIELAPEQFNLAIKEAITFYQRNHFDGSEQLYLPIQITEDIKSKRYIELDESVIGINGLFDISAGSGLLTTDFMITADAAWTAFRTNGGLSGFYNLMSYRSLMQEMFASKVCLRFNYNRGRVYLDISPERLVVGNWIVLDINSALDPELDERMFNDPWLADYSEACVKRIWGQTLKKYQQVTLPGGITLDGQTLYSEANEAKEKLEDEIISKWQLPINMLVG